MGLGPERRGKMGVGGRGENCNVVTHIKVHMKRNRFFNSLKVHHFKDTIAKLEPCFKRNWEFYNTWKLSNFALKNGLFLRIAWPKCPNDVSLWTRLLDIPVVIWRFREMTQFRIAEHVVFPEKPFFLINFVNKPTSRDEIAQ